MEDDKWWRHTAAMSGSDARSPTTTAFGFDAASAMEFSDRSRTASNGAGVKVFGASTALSRAARAATKLIVANSRSASDTSRCSKRASRRLPPPRAYEDRSFKSIATQLITPSYGVSSRSRGSVRHFCHAEEPLYADRSHSGHPKVRGAIKQKGGSRPALAPQMILLALTAQAESTLRQKRTCSVSPISLHSI